MPDYYTGGGSALLGIPIISTPGHKGKRTVEFKVSTYIHTRFSLLTEKWID